MVEGRCNCAGIKISIPSMPEQSAICYCSNCRRAGSSVGSVIYMMDKTDVSLDDPNHYLKSYTDQDTKSGNTITRQFCSNCGCPVFSILDPTSPKVIIKGGLFLELPPPGFKSFDDEEPKWLRVIKHGEEGL